MSFYDTYKITKQDLEKRNYGVFIDGLDEAFLIFINEQRKAGHQIVSDENIVNVVRKTKRGIYTNIIILFILGVFCLILGLYQFLYTEPLIGMNLYTQFPVISNGAIEIAGSTMLLIGCIYSYIKRKEVLERLVKSELIEDLKKLKREIDNLPVRQTKKRKRFKQSFKVGKKKS
ncbi:hypothetical protein [uncultured Winogradskyella sp.]|uniref:hypothetical protein n=1 Tax=uncultured Winogradskyella sp. TaxID=395353 RepID=UPI00260813D2|nr:hypothetical protein [uncultured Winogradskyella sp.]